MNNKKVNDDFQASNMQGNPKALSNKEEKKIKVEKDENIINKDDSKEIVSELDVISTTESNKAISIDEIKKKRGNYIFTIGYASSGKSVLQNMLLYRLSQRRDMQLYFKGEDDDFGHDEFINNWIVDMDRGILPARSQEKPREFCFSFIPDGKKELELSMLELAGEKIQTVIPREGHKPTLGAEMDEYLKLKSIKRQFIFISDPTRNKKYKSKSPNNTDEYQTEDILFNSFLQFLRKEENSIDGKLKILFIVSKWDLIENDYKDKESDYFEENFPLTLANIQLNDKIDKIYIPFSVGKVDERNETLLVEKEVKYVDKFIEKIYYSFYPKLWDKIKKWVQQLCKKIIFW